MTSDASNIPSCSFPFDLSSVLRSPVLPRPIVVFQMRGRVALGGPALSLCVIIHHNHPYQQQKEHMRSSQTENLLLKWN